MHIIEENFKEIDSKLLLDPKWYQDVEDMVASIDAAATPDYAKEYALALANKLDNLADSMDPQLLNKYLRLLKALRLLSLVNVKDNEKQKFFSEQILDLFYLDFVEVEHSTDQLFKYYSEAPEIINDLRKAIIAGLESNFQRIGKDNLVVRGTDQNLAPTLQNWLKDYASFTRIDPKKNISGPLDQVNYMNQSSNVKKLSPADRAALFKLIKFYDWIRFAELNYDFSYPINTKKPDIELPGDRQELIPKELADSVNASIAKEPRKAEPPAPKFIPPPTRIVPPAPVKTFSPPQPPAPTTELTDFEKRLAAVSAVPAHGADLEVLKHKIEDSKISFAPMDRPVERPVSAPIKPAPVSTGAVKMTPDEIKRETTTRELPGPISQAPRPQVQTPVAPAPVIPKPQEIKPAPKPVFVPPPAPKPQVIPPRPTTWETRATNPMANLNLRTLNDIKVLEDLKNIDVVHLRQGTLSGQTSLIKSKILALAKANKVLPYYAVIAFEASPLFNSYLMTGNGKMIDTQSVSDLNHSEFEAIADLRKEIERL